MLNNSRREFLIGTGASVLAGLLGAPANAVRRGSVDWATVIYRNARVWTGIRSMPWSDAIALSGNRIGALGERASTSIATRKTRTIDLNAEDHPGAFTPELHVENIEPVRPGDPARNVPHVLDDVAAHIPGPYVLSGFVSSVVSGTGRTCLKQKKWAQAHSLLHPGNPKL